MAKSHKSNYLIWGLALVGVIGLIYAGSNHNDILAFEIPIPNELRIAGGDDPHNTGDQLDIPDPDIDAGDLSGVLCFIKSTMQGYTVNGNLVLTEQSPFLFQYPRIQSLTGGELNSEIDHYKVVPKIRCEVQGDYPMTITQASLKAFVVSTNQETKDVREVWDSGVSRVVRDIPIVFNHEEELTVFTVKSSDIENYLASGEYQTELKFQVSGTMDIEYDNFQISGKQNLITIPRESIQTKTNVIVSIIGETGIDGEPIPIEPKGKELPTCTNGQQLNDAGVCADVEPSNVNFYTELSSCLQTFDTNCLMQQKFIPLYAGSVGMLFLLGAVGTRNKPMFDQFGNRMS